MARTTGYTCTAAVNLVLNEKFSRKGVFPAEFLGEEEENFTFILNYLKDRGVMYKISN
jgi:lysine 6-dehydrogenase